jgi:hypothetical protein
MVTFKLSNAGTYRAKLRLEQYLHVHKTESKDPMHKCPLSENQVRGQEDYALNFFFSPFLRNHAKCFSAPQYPFLYSSGKPATQPSPQSPAPAIFFLYFLGHTQRCRQATATRSALLTSEA